MALGCAVLVVAVGCAWAGFDAHWRWRVLRLAIPLDRRCAMVEWDPWLQKGTQPAAQWLADATELLRSDDPVRGTAPGGNLWRTFGWSDDVRYPIVIDDALSSASLDFAEAAAQWSAPAMAEEMRMAMWNAIRERPGLAGMPSQADEVTAQAATFLVSSSLWANLDLPFTEGAIVIRSAEWRDAAGAWHELPRTPWVCEARMWRSAPLTLFESAADAGATEVRCRGDLVVASTRKYEARTVPFEWHGKAK